MYAEIENNNVVNIYDSLPLCYKNISNFFALDTELLHDLTWSGNAGVKFYEYVPDNIPENHTIQSTSYTIDHEAKKVYGSYITQISPPPQTISARQIRLWLLQNGISLQMVSDAIAAIQDPVTRDSVSIEWEYAPYIERNHPMLVPLAQALGLTESDIDRGFIEAINI